MSRAEFAHGAAAALEPRVCALGPHGTLPLSSKRESYSNTHSFSAHSTQLLQQVRSHGSLTQLPRVARSPPIRLARGTAGFPADRAGVFPHMLVFQLRLGKCAGQEHSEVRWSSQTDRARNEAGWSTGWRACTASGSDRKGIPFC